MISKARIRYINSLQVKKYRKQEQCFVVEGARAVHEVLQSHYGVRWLACTEAFHRQHASLFASAAFDWVIADEEELAQAGSLASNNAALAVVAMQEPPPLRFDQPLLVLDDIRDPGNLGTIIRIADWFGISSLVASPQTADFYSPKVIHATMGSFCRVHLHVHELPPFLADLPMPAIGAFLEGENVHAFTFPKPFALVIGNEAHGISAAVEHHVRFRVTIPRFGGAESLNAAVATAVLLDNFRRL